MRTFLLPRDETRVTRWLWRVTLVVVCAHSALFCWSIYRRLWQVQRIEIVASATVLTPATEIGYDVITSGEVRNRIVLELVQGERRETLREELSDHNRFSAYDPRVFHYAPKFEVGANALVGFSPGPALLRLTVFGAQKLLRTPPPRIREMRVEIAPPRHLQSN